MSEKTYLFVEIPKAERTDFEEWLWDAAEAAFCVSDTDLETIVNTWIDNHSNEVRSLDDWSDMCEDPDFSFAMDDEWWNANMETDLGCVMQNE